VPLQMPYQLPRRPLCECRHCRRRKRRRRRRGHHPAADAAVAAPATLPSSSPLLPPPPPLARAGQNACVFKAGPALAEKPTVMSLTWTPKRYVYLHSVLVRLISCTFTRYRQQSTCIIFTCSFGEIVVRIIFYLQLVSLVNRCALQRLAVRRRARCCVTDLGLSTCAPQYLY
jgi:hypothetical protein